jgi:hypothetical protein
MRRLRPEGIQYPEVRSERKDIKLKLVDEDNHSIKEEQPNVGL